MSKPTKKISHTLTHDELITYNILVESLHLSDVSEEERESLIISIGLIALEKAIKEMQEKGAVKYPTCDQIWEHIEQH